MIKYFKKEKTYLEVDDEFFDGVESVRWGLGDSRRDYIHVDLTCVGVGGSLLHGVLD